MRIDARSARRTLALGGRRGGLWSACRYRRAILSGVEDRADLLREARKSIWEKRGRVRIGAADASVVSHFPTGFLVMLMTCRSGECYGEVLFPASR